MEEAENTFESSSTYESAAEQVVALGNRILDDNTEADTWDLASGLLAGAIQFWLYSRQPCNNAFCEDCADISTAELRIRKLLDEVREHAEHSDYYQSPHDMNVGTA
jgi:hypothetical protein